MKKSVVGRFKMLRTVALLLRILAWVSFLGSIVLAIMLWISPNVLEQYGLSTAYSSIWLSGIAVLIGGVIYAIILFALSEGTYVFLSIEENTRRLKEILDKK